MTFFGIDFPSRQVFRPKLAVMRPSPEHTKPLFTLRQFD
jgi:hypothetical protein